MKDIFLGGLVKAFGIRGEVKFHPSDDFWEDLLGSKRLMLHERADEEVHERRLAIERSRPHGRSYVLKLEGVDDRNTAEALVGSEVFIAEDEIDVELPEQLLPFQVVGMSVRSEEGDVLGEVSGIIYSPAHDVYEVTGDNGTFLVPVIPEFIVSIDEEAATLILRPLPGLLDEKS